MEDILDKSLVGDPSICNLLLRISGSRLDAAVYSVIHDNSIITRSWALGAAGETTLRSLEDTVYDNPLLLSDFRRTYCIIQTGNAMAIPAEVEDERLRDAMFRELHPDFEGEVLTSPTATRNAVMVYGPDAGIVGFLRRTFHDAAIDCHISSLCRYFASKPGRGNSRRVICNFRPDELDIVILDGGNLILANTFRFKAPADAAYYILATCKSLALDSHTDELLLAGDQAVRETLVPTLRNFMARVMPVIFPPQMFKAGKDAMRAPFDLIVTPLCE